MAGIARGCDAIGNTAHIGGAAREFIYNADDRLSQVKQAGLVKASYRYNARGERVARADSASGPASVLSLYDEAGHWVGDYSGTVASWNFVLFQRTRGKASLFLGGLRNKRLN